MTVNDFFDSLLDRINLRIDDKERKSIQDKQNKLREKLREKLPLQDDFLTGSYARDTIIKPEEDGEEFDVDVFIAFGDKDYGTKELSELHGIVAKALNEIKNESADLGIKNIDTKQRRSIGVEFGNGFQVDIVPSIEIEKGKLYKIYDKRTLKAVNSNPKLHGEQLTEANKRTGGKLVPIVKMLKAWKREKCDYVKSFHLELLAVKILGNGIIESYPAGVAAFFTNAPEHLRKACLSDPANPSMLVDTYLDEDGTRAQLLGLVSEENSVAARALALERTGDQGAVREWLNIFKDDEFETAEAVRAGGFYSGNGGVRPAKNDSNDRRISAPRSWGE